MPGVLLCCLAHQAHRGPPPTRLGSYPVDRHIRHLKGHPGWDLLCSSVLRCLMGQPLYCSFTSAGLWGERVYGDSFTPYMGLSSIPSLLWLPDFLPQVFPTTVSSPTSPRFISSQEIAVLTSLGFLHNPQTPAPSHCTFQGTCVPVPGMYGCGKDCLILVPFRRPQISCFIISLTQTIAPMWGSDPCFSSLPPPPAKGRYSPANTPVFPPSSFVLPSFAWVYTHFSTGQVFLSALSWCSACTSVSEGVFLMFPWREMYSISTYSPATLFSSQYIFNIVSQT